MGLYWRSCALRTLEQFCTNSRYGKLLSNVDVAVLNTTMPGVSHTSTDSDPTKL
jgi:hypothetical protein